MYTLVNSAVIDFGVSYFQDGVGWTCINVQISQIYSIFYTKMELGGTKSSIENGLLPDIMEK